MAAGKNRKTPEAKGPDAGEELSRCINLLLLREPFFAHVLSGLARKFTEDTRTAAVGVLGDKVVLYINPGFFLGRLKSTSARVAVLKHEVLHVILKHLFREGYVADMEIFNMAADIVVNQYVGEWQLPETAITIERFPDMGLELGQTAEYYYRELKKRRQGGTGLDSATKGGEVLDALYGHPTHSDHSLWAEPGMSSGEPGPGSVISEAVESRIESLLVQSYNRTPAKSHGSIPGGIRKILDSIMAGRKPELDWRRVLRLFSTAHGTTRIWHSMKRVSKRFGTRPGIRIARSRSLAVVLDTSGSIGDACLASFMAEVEGMRRAGSLVTIIESDCKVQDVYPYRPGREFHPKGGGGTDFNDALRFVRRRRSFDACIYLTDGFAPEPTEKPNCPLLWVLPENGHSGGHLPWGKTIILPGSG